MVQYNAIAVKSALALFQERGARVPLLIGSNREEASGLYLGNGTLENNSANIGSSNAFRHGDFVRYVADLVGAKNQAAALALYPTSAYDSTQWALITMGTDAIYTCPTRRLAVAASTYGPTYRYLFTHVMENDPDQAYFRAFHSLEDTFLWRHFYPHLSTGDPYIATPTEEALSWESEDSGTSLLDRRSMTEHRPKNKTGCPLKMATVRTAPAT